MSKYYCCGSYDEHAALCLKTELDRVTAERDSALSGWNTAAEHWVSRQVELEKERNSALASHDSKDRLWRKSVVERIELLARLIRQDHKIATARREGMEAGKEWSAAYLDKIYGCDRLAKDLRALPLEKEES